MRFYRVALIGTGWFAGYHVDALRQAGERVQLVAAVNAGVERGRTFCQTHGIPAFYPTATEMLAAERPDLVHICTPSGTHTRLAIQCLEAGAHVLCEKPLCGSLADMDKLDAAEAASGRYLSTVFQWRFGSAAQYVKQLIQSGEPGKLLLATCLTLWYRDMHYFSVAWRGQRMTALGGVTMGHGIHLMDLLLWLTGDWHELQAVTARLNHPIEVEDVSLAMVKFENGAYGSIVNSLVSPRQESHLRFDFQRATIEVRALYSYTNENWQFSLPAGSTEDTGGWTIPEKRPGVLSSQVTALLDSLDRGERPLASGSESRRIIEFNTGVYKSALTGQAVQRASLTPDDPFYNSMTGEA